MLFFGDTAVREQAEDLLEHWKQLVERTKLETEEKDRKDKDAEEKRRVAEAEKRKEKEELEGLLASGFSPRSLPDNTLVCLL